MAPYSVDITQLWEGIVVGQRLIPFAFVPSTLLAISSCSASTLPSFFCIACYFLGYCKRFLLLVLFFTAEAVVYIKGVDSVYIYKLESLSFCIPVTCLFLFLTHFLELLFPRSAGKFFLLQMHGVPCSVELLVSCQARFGHPHRVTQMSRCSGCPCSSIHSIHVHGLVNKKMMRLFMLCPWVILSVGRKERIS